MTSLIKFAFIYKLYHTLNDKLVYIGQTIDINSRFKNHIRNANDNNCLSIRLYFFMNFYGIQNFDIVILKTLRNVTQQDINFTENTLIKQFGTLNTIGSDINIVLKIDTNIIN